MTTTMASNPTLQISISNLLDKMMSSDKDFRFMATNDLMAELQKDSIKLDDDSEKKIIKMLLKLLEDKNGEVQNLAVKCLGPLVKKVKVQQIEVVVMTLCNNMASDKEQLRDISSIGLKTVINELPTTSENLVENVCHNITERISSVILKDDISVQLEALDILADLLTRFGYHLGTFHKEILEALLPQLSSSRQAVRKRAIVALSNFVVSCNSGLYTRIISYLLSGLEVDYSSSAKCTYIQTTASICRVAGSRFGEHLNRFFPIIQNFSLEEDDELREFCLQAFEAFVQKCPKEITPHIPAITELCLKYITYDPNYNYDDDGDGDSMMETDDDITELNDEDDEGDDDEYSDDDDMSWKVRRAAAKCLESIIATRRDLLIDFYKALSPKVIARFKEREENVKSDIFQVYITLLKQTKLAVVPNIESVYSMDEETPISLLQSQVSMIVKAIQIQMRERSIKTRLDCLALLRELVSVLPAALNDHIAVLIPGIQYSLSDKNSSSNMKITTLSFINTMMSTHSAEIFHPYMDSLVPPITSSVADNFYKITAEALMCLKQLVKVIRPLDTSSNFDFTLYINKIYQCTLSRLKTSDIDQEVKERAISCMGQIICNLGDHLKNELVVCLPIFLDRLKNEITRLTTVKALTKVAGSPLKIDLRPIMSEAALTLSTFLRKNNRALKLYTLILLDKLVNNYNSSFNSELLALVMVELPPLISDTDLYIAHLTLNLLTSVAKTQSTAIPCPIIIPVVISLTMSSLLQGGALQSVLTFLHTLVNAKIPKFGFTELLTKFMEPVIARANERCQTLHKQVFQSVAKCVAAIAIIKIENAINLVAKFLKGIESSRYDERVIFSLRVIGEIGRHVDLHKMESLKDVLIKCLSSNYEDTKTSASFAIGGIAIGNLEHYLPIILRETETQPKQQYLLLHSLKEVISCLSVNEKGVQQLQPFVQPIWARLFDYCECPEEGTRNVVAECMGKLTLINPDTLLPQLKDSMVSPSGLKRATVLTAVKFTICDQPQPIDIMLKQYAGHFLKSLEDSDINVRRVALVFFNSATHNKPSLVRDLLETILPNLYAETIVKKELIHEVEMGPFKHTVDDGLDIRKAAFECMYTLLDTCLDRIDIFEFLSRVEMGLKDHYDIQMLTYLMVTRLAQLSPSAVLQRLERLVSPLRATCFSKVKTNSVKQEFEKQDELKRAALRAVSALLAMPDATKDHHLNDFVINIKNSEELNKVFENIQKDTSVNSMSEITYNAATKMDTS